MNNDPFLRIMTLFVRILIPFVRILTLFPTTCVYVSARQNALIPLSIPLIPFDSLVSGCTNYVSQSKIIDASQRNLL